MPNVFERFQNKEKFMNDILENNSDDIIIWNHKSHLHLDLNNTKPFKTIPEIEGFDYKGGLIEIQKFYNIDNSFNFANNYWICDKSKFNLIQDYDDDNDLISEDDVDKIECLAKAVNIQTNSISVEKAKFKDLSEFLNIYKNNTQKKDVTVGLSAYFVIAKIKYVGKGKFEGIELSINTAEIDDSDSDNVNQIDDCYHRYLKISNKSSSISNKELIEKFQKQFNIENITRSAIIEYIRRNILFGYQKMKYDIDSSINEYFEDIDNGNKFSNFEEDILIKNINQFYNDPIIADI